MREGEGRRECRERAARVRRVGVRGVWTRGHNREQQTKRGFLQVVISSPTDMTTRLLHMLKSIAYPARRMMIMIIGPGKQSYIKPIPLV